MARTPEKVEEFLVELWQYALRRAKAELAEMQQIADEEGAGFKIAPWDWWYYAEKLRQKKYDLKDEEVRPYFSIDNVRNGMFTLAGLLYGLKFEKLNNVSVYHPEVEVYEVKEKNGQQVGLLYLDFFPRTSKRSGAWSGALRRQSYDRGKRIAPLSTISCNFTRPTETLPALLSLDEVQTAFHEFGHSLATLLANGKYNKSLCSPRRSGVAFSNHGKLGDRARISENVRQPLCQRRSNSRGSDQKNKKQHPFQPGIRFHRIPGRITAGSLLAQNHL